MILVEFLYCDTESLENGGQLLLLFRIGRIFVYRPQSLYILILILKVLERKFSATWIITFLPVIGFDVAIDLFDKRERSLIRGVDLQPADASYEGCRIPKCLI